MSKSVIIKTLLFQVTLDEVCGLDLQMNQGLRLNLSRSRLDSSHKDVNESTAYLLSSQSLKEIKTDYYTH